MKDEFEKNPEYVDILKHLKEEEVNLAGIEEQLRSAWISVAKLTEDGKIEVDNPSEVVVLKKFSVKKVVYESKKAFNYCLHNLTTALDLNVKEFEKQAKSGKLPDDIVELKEENEIRAQLASDVKKYETIYYNVMSLGDGVSVEETERDNT